MAYSSPLGYNFKLEQSLSALKNENANETPKKEESSRNFSEPRKSFYNDKRNSRENNSRNSRNDSSPGWQRSSNEWSSPNPRNSQGDSVPISQYYHPSMLEDPWEELENMNKKTSSDA